MEAESLTLIRIKNSLSSWARKVLREFSS